MNQKSVTVILFVSLAVNVMLITAIGVFFLTGRTRPRVRAPIAPWAAEGRDWHKSQLKQRLGLTDAQVGEINELQDIIRKTAQPIAEDLMKKRRQLMELLRDPDADSARADLIFQEIVALQTHLETMAFHNMKKMHDLLTPEQRTGLMRLMEKRHPPLFHGPPPMTGRN